MVNNHITEIYLTATLSTLSIVRPKIKTIGLHHLSDDTLHVISYGDHSDF